MYFTSHLLNSIIIYNITESFLMHGKYIFKLESHCLCVTWKLSTIISSYCNNFQQIQIIYRATIYIYIQWRSFCLRKTAQKPRTRLENAEYNMKMLIDSSHMYRVVSLKYRFWRFQYIYFHKKSYKVYFYFSHNSIFIIISFIYFILMKKNSDWKMSLNV